MNTRFDNRTVLITGGAGGIGAELARKFHADGANVVISDLAQDAGSALAEELGDKAIFIRHDVTDAQQWADIVHAAEEAFGPISVLCNNAGIADMGLIADMPLDVFERVLKINVSGVFLGMQSVLPSMRRAGGGSIINTSSSAGLAGFHYSCAYSSSKFAVRGITKVAALEFAADNIRVNSIHPGMITTGMTTGYVPDPRQPIPRAGTVAEVADLVQFLASDNSSYCTGSEFIIDGGQLVLAGTPEGAATAGSSD